MFVIKKNIFDLLIMIDAMILTAIQHSLAHLHFDTFSIKKKCGLSIGIFNLN